MKQDRRYGVKDTSYKAAGEFEGLERLVSSFYGYMDTLAEAKVIRAMHPEDLSLSSTKLAYFLSGWLGGPRIFSEKFGPIRIPKAHSHLPISSKEGEAWMFCMEKALQDQPYEKEFKVYLMEQLQVPTNRIVQACNPSS